MSAIASAVRRYWVELAWGAFAAANVAVMLLVPRYETIPFHFVWVSLTIVYGVRVWSLRSTVSVLTAVTAATGAAMALVVIGLHEKLDEAAEVPLMAMMFVVMVWHARRRQAAIEEVQRLAESEHRLLEREREFVRDASHEFRTPITVARGHAELILEATGGPARQDAEVVVAELNRLWRLSERLLLLAAAEHPRFLRRGPVPLEPLIVRTVNRWSAAAPRRWKIDAPAEGSVVADEERLSIALDALVENAIQHTGEGDEISIASRTTDGTALIEVLDTGDGIPADRLEQIFDRFARVDNGRDRQRGGTGLGLPIARAIVEAHGGSIGVSSEAGRGSVFRIVLPSLQPANR